MGNPKKEGHIKAVIAALVENVVLCEFSLWKRVRYEFESNLANWLEYKDEEGDLLGFRLE